MSLASKGPKRGRVTGADAQLAEGLANLGLTEYEIRVYLAILRHPRSRVPEIARWSEVPQPKVYATLKRLIERGLCESLLGPINRYAALPPQEAFRPLIEDMKAREQETKSAVSALKSEFGESNKSLSRREGRIKLFQGKHAAGRNFKFLLSNAEEAVCVLARIPLVVSDDATIIKELVARGVDIRLLVEVSDEHRGEVNDILSEQRETGARMRLIEKLPMRMAIFDNKITALPMVDPQPGEGDGFIMLEIRNQSLSEGFTNMFDMLWENARKF
jgi:sugar-specific transcriptional regulator TrmB